MSERKFRKFDLRKTGERIFKGKVFATTWRTELYLATEDQYDSHEGLPDSEPPIKVIEYSAVGVWREQCQKLEESMKYIAAGGCGKTGCTCMRDTALIALADHAKFKQEVNES